MKAFFSDMFLDLYENFAEVFFNIIVMIVVMIVGLIVSWLVRKLIEKLLILFRFDKWAARRRDYHLPRKGRRKGPAVLDHKPHRLLDIHDHGSSPSASIWSA